jgi:hypothetical protein
MLPAQHLLDELTPVVESLLERHLSASKEWFPHEHVPYGRGRDPIAGEQWTEADADLAGATINDAVRSALLVNLLTGTTSRTTSARSRACSAPMVRGAHGCGAGPLRSNATRWRSTAT